MWIFLTKKLPTQVSPPRMSIHWAEPWGVDNEYLKQQQIIAKDKEAIEIYGERHGVRLEDLGDRYVENGLPAWGFVAKEDGAMGLLYKDQHIKVYPHEYSELTPERMRDYVFGMAGDDVISHNLVPRAEADALLLKVAEDTALKDVKEAAVLDGCNEMQSLALLMGMDIEDASAEFPPVGWFRCKPELALYWCEEWELEE